MKFKRAIDWFKLTGQARNVKRVGVVAKPKKDAKA